MTEENTSQSIQPGPPKFKVGQRVALPKLQISGEAAAAVRENREQLPPQRQEGYIKRIVCDNVDNFKRDWSGNTCKCTESEENKDNNGSMLCTERKYADNYKYNVVNIPQSLIKDESALILPGDNEVKPLEQDQLDTVPCPKTCYSTHYILIFMIIAIIFIFQQLIFGRAGEEVDGKKQLSTMQAILILVMLVVFILMVLNLTGVTNGGILSHIFSCGTLCQNLDCDNSSNADNLTCVSYNNTLKEGGITSESLIEKRKEKRYYRLHNIENKTNVPGLYKALDKFFTGYED